MSIVTSQNNQAQTPVPKKRRPVIWGVAGLVVVAIIILVVLFITGVIKTPGTEVEESGVCGSDVITNQNDVRIVAVPAGNWPKELAKIADKVRQTAYHEDDVNCLFILTQDSIEKKEWSNAQYYAQRIKDKAADSDDNKISPRLISISPDDLVKYVDYVFAVNGEDTKGKGQK